MNRQSVRTHFRRVGIVVSTMWSRGTGRFSLIVLGLWVLVSLVSLFWTPRSLWQTEPNTPTCLLYTSPSPRD